MKRAAIFAVLILFPALSHAQTLGATLVSTSSGVRLTQDPSCSSTTCETIAFIGHGLNNRLGSIWVYMFGSPVRSGSGNIALYANVYYSPTPLDRSNLGSVTFVESGSTTLITSTSSQLQVIRFSGNYTFQPDYYYYINFFPVGDYGGNEIYLDAGTATSTNLNSGDQIAVWCFDGTGSNFKACPSSILGLNFSIRSDVVSFSNAVDLTIPNPAGVLPACSITDISQCVINALAYAFIPTASSTDQFSTLIDILKKKPPLGYLTGAFQIVSDVNASATPAFFLATSSPLMTYIFTPLRSGVLIILYVMLVFFILKRVGEVNI